MGDDRVRGFPAFPKLARRPAGFARSWWGHAWLAALEDTALDPEPTARGRRYAYSGRVGPITVSPGRIAAPVYGEDGTPYRTAVFVEPLTDAEWERFLEEVAARAGHLAALLDGEMPGELADAAAEVGVRLLPGLGDLEPECDCPGWDLPCAHAAALCYQAAWLLDSDPFVLLLMRGRGQRELLDDLQRRNVATPEAISPHVSPHPSPRMPPGMAADPAAGVPDARSLLALPPAPGVDPDALELLAGDAAVRAGELLAGRAEEPLPALDVWQDTVRLAATYPPLFVRLRQESGRPSSQFARAVRAWEYGGRAGLDVLEDGWSPPKAEVARARDAVAAAWEGDDVPDVTVWRNRLTVPDRGMQVRYGADGRWYPYREVSGDWWPAGPPHRGPSAAFAELLTR